MKLNRANRREFLKLMAGSFSLSLMGSLAEALEAGKMNPQARFVLIRVHGAMDSTMGLHPVAAAIDGLAREDLFLGYDPLKDVIQPAGTKITLGPAAQDISEFAAQMAIVRGIYVGPADLGHPYALHHMTSGFSQESAPFFSSVMSSHFKAEGEFAITNTALQRGTLARFPTLLTSVLRSQFIDGQNSSPDGSRPISRLNIYKDKSLGLNRYLEFMQRQDRIAKFTEAVQLAQSQSTKLSDCAIAAASLYSGLGRIAQIDIDLTHLENGITLDTHVAHEQNHKNAQTARWKMIGDFLRLLRQLNLLEHTLVAVITEFNRTPGMNANGGKDHNYSDNAVALFGRGLNGGNVIGDRKLYTRGDGFPYAYWGGSFIDFKGSGQVVDVKKGVSAPVGVDLIRPSDVVATIAKSFDAKLLGQAPEGAKIIPGLFT